MENAIPCWVNEYTSFPVNLRSYALSHSLRSKPRVIYFQIHGLGVTLTESHLKQKHPNISTIVEFIRAEIFLSAAPCGSERTWVRPSPSPADTRRYLRGGRGPTFVAVTV